MTITLTREEAQQVLDLLEYFNQFSLPPHGIAIPAEIDDLMDALRARLRAPEPKPVAFHGWYCNKCQRHVDSREVTFYERHEECGRLITNDTPPQREWQGLTHEEIAEESGAAKAQNHMVLTLAEGFFCGARWAEAKLQEKNT
jgi:hypothetical protein